MTQTRIYVPLDTARMRELAETRRSARLPLGAFAVTGRLERAAPDRRRGGVGVCGAVEAAEAAAARPRRGPHQASDRGSGRRP